jgi:hypothetical protein
MIGSRPNQNNLFRPGHPDGSLAYSAFPQSFFLAPLKITAIRSRTKKCAEICDSSQSSLSSGADVVNIVAEKIGKNWRSRLETTLNNAKKLS